VDERTGRCQDCGAVHGKAYRCPHCRTVADAEPDGVLGQRCRVCGGPRILVDDVSIPRSGREVPTLEEARRLRTRSIAWRMASGLLGAFGALSLLVALGVLAVVSPGILGTVATLAMAVAPVALAAVGWTRARRYDKSVAVEMDRARRLVAADVVSAHGGQMEAKALGKVMGIDEARAELLLAEVSVEDLVRARVEDVPRARVAPEAKAGEAEQAEAEQTEAEQTEAEQTEAEQAARVVAASVSSDDEK
jgi:hypothetical protein